MTINQTKWSKVAATLVFGLAIVFTLVLVAFWSGLLGNDKLEIVFSVPTGLILLISICIAVGITLRYTYTIERNHSALEQEKATLERKVEILKQDIATIKRVSDSTQFAPVIDYHLTIDDKKGKVFRGTEEIKLTPQQFKLLKCLMNKEGICERDYILRQVFGKKYDDPDTPATLNDLTQLISHLRKRINIEYIKNYRGHGYEFVQWKGK